MKKCSICGKEYVTNTYKIGDKQMKVEVPACDCEYLQREKEEQLRKEQKRLDEIKAKTNNLKRELNCPLMSPLFADKTFDKYFNNPMKPQWEKQYDANFRRCIDYANAFDKESKGLFMIGNVGTGKTTLQACIIKELEKRGKICLLINFSTLLDLCIQSCSFESKLTVSKILDTLTQFDYIVLDDMGREKYTDKRLEIAFRIIDTLMNYKVTVSLTVNPECFQKLAKIEEYKAIIDRLRFLCPEQMTFNNESFRGAM